MLLAGYMLFPYTEFVWDAETRYNVGWVHCGILGLNLLGNFSFMIRASYHGVRLRLRRRYLK